MPNSAMIFAAGRGTRMGSLTKDCPKPLIKVSGRPLIDYAMDLVQSSPIEKTVVNVHYLADQIADHLRDQDVLLSYEAGTVLETGGGLKKALTLLKSDTVVTLNSDAVWTGANPINALLSAWDPANMDALLMLVDHPDAIGHNGAGDFLMSTDGTLQRGQGLTYTGCQIIKTQFVEAIPQDVFSLNLAWDSILQTDRAFGLRHHGQWCDVGHPEGITLAEAMLRNADV